MVSNGEYMPVLQTPDQKLVETKIISMADANSKRIGMSRREYLRSSCGMAVAFLAMNSVFGKFFSVDATEAFEPEAAALGSVPREPSSLMTNCITLAIRGPIQSY